MTPTSSQAKILSAARKNAPADMPMPEPISAAIRYDDPLAQFTTMLAAIGGEAIAVSSYSEADALLRDRYDSALPWCSFVASVGETNVELSQLHDPHSLAHLDVAILPGHLAVAENGAIWITQSGEYSRAVYFLCEHLVLVISAADIVHNLHEGYERIAERGLYPHQGFAAWVAGPSKTADIEQSLVIGAQGPRSLLVFVIK